MQPVEAAGWRRECVRSQVEFRLFFLAQRHRVKVDDVSGSGDVGEAGSTEGCSQSSRNYLACLFGQNLHQCIASVVCVRHYQSVSYKEHAVLTNGKWHSCRL